MLRSIKAAIVAEIGHGHWLTWLAARKIAETTARCWIRAADWIDESAIVAEMDLGAIYRGARAPTEVKSEIVRSLKAGDAVDLDRVVGLIKLHKNATSEIDWANSAQSTRPNERAAAGEADTQVDATPSRKNAAKAAEDVVRALSAFFDDDEISILNARWEEATSAEVERVLQKRSGSSVAQLK